MIIGTITNGIVIDHIPAGCGMEIYRYLRLDERECEVALIKNATSVKLGKKDIIKINEIIQLDFDMLGYIAPKSTVDIIENGKLMKKLHPSLPQTLTGIIRCKNPRCITSTEQDLPHIFRLTDPAKGIYRCAYCDTRAESQSLL